MGAFVCSNCDTKIRNRISFCPECGRPTPFASEEETMRWDLDQWRSYRDRRAADARPTTSVSQVAVGAGRPAAPRVQHQRPTTARRERPEVRQQEASRVRVERRLRLGPLLERLRSLRSESSNGHQVIDLDHDDPFAYTACVTCQRTDWVLRTRRNGDGTWNYWCIRCSRSFKTEVRLPHGVKPFITSALILGLLAAMPYLL